MQCKLYSKAVTTAICEASHQVAAGSAVVTQQTYCQALVAGERTMWRWNDDWQNEWNCSTYVCHRPTITWTKTAKNRSLNGVADTQFIMHADSRRLAAAILPCIPELRDLIIFLNIAVRLDINACISPVSTFNLLTAILSDHFKILQQWTQFTL